MTEVEFSPESEVVETLVGERDLIVFNDDVNTFDHVIDSFIKICKHEAVQAEQCAWIIHFSGKCQIKSGTYEELEPMCTALLDRGLSAEIQ